MIDNNVDRMSVNILPFSLDRIVKKLEEPGFVDPDLFNRIVKPLPEEPVDLLRRISSLVRCVRTNPDFFVNIFKSDNR